MATLLYRLLPFVFFLTACAAFKEHLSAAGQAATDGLPRLAENPSTGGLVEYLLPIVVAAILGGGASVGAVKVKRALTKPTI
jgi:hypothetical protein